MRRPQKKQFPSERGAALTEYTLLVALIAIAAIIAVRAFGTAHADAVEDIRAEFVGAGTAPLAEACGANCNEL